MNTAINKAANHETLPEIINHLQKTATFGDFALEFLEKMAQFSVLMRLREGEPVFNPTKEVGHDLFLLISGALEVVSQYTAANKGGIIVQFTPVQNEVFGEIGWLLKSQRTAMVKAIKVTEVIRINGDRLDELLHSFPEVDLRLNQYLAKTLAKKLGSTDKVIDALLKKQSF